MNKIEYVKYSVVAFEFLCYCVGVSHLDQNWNTKQERKESASSSGEPPVRLMPKLSQQANNDTQTWRYISKNLVSHQANLKQSISSIKSPTSTRRHKS